MEWSWDTYLCLSRDQENAVAADQDVDLPRDKDRLEPEALAAQHRRIIAGVPSIPTRTMPTRWSG